MVPMPSFKAGFLPFTCIKAGELIAGCDPARKEEYDEIILMGIKVRHISRSPLTITNVCTAGTDLDP